MILITITINEGSEGQLDVCMKGQDIIKFTTLEGDMADCIKQAIQKRRDRFMEEHGYIGTVGANEYGRTFSSSEERDKHAEGGAI